MRYINLRLTYLLTESATLKFIDYNVAMTFILIIILLLLLRRNKRQPQVMTTSMWNS